MCGVFLDLKKEQYADSHSWVIERLVNNVFHCIKNMEPNDNIIMIAQSASNIYFA